LVRPNKDTPQLPFTFYLTHLLFEKKYLQRFDRAQKESMFAYRKAFRKRRALKKVAGEQVQGGTEEKNSVIEKRNLSPCNLSFDEEVNQPIVQKTKKSKKKTE